MRVQEIILENKIIMESSELLRVGNQWMVSYGDGFDPANTQIFDNRSDAVKAQQLFDRRGTRTRGVRSFADLRQAMRDAKGLDAVTGRDVKLQFSRKFTAPFKFLSRIVQILGVIQLWNNHVDMQGDLYLDYRSGVFGTGTTGRENYKKASEALAGMFVVQLAAQAIIAIKAGRVITRILSVVRLAAAGGATTVVGAVPALLTWLATEAAVGIAIWYLSDRENMEWLLAWLYKDGWDSVIGDVLGGISLSLDSIANEVGATENLRQAMQMDPEADAAETDAASQFTPNAAPSQQNFNDLRSRIQF